MRMKLRGLWPLFGVVSMGLFAPAFAGQCQRGYGSQSAAGMQQTDREAYQRGIYREIAPAAGPIVENGVNLFFQAEPFYWRAVKDGSGYCFHGLKRGETTTSTHQPAPLGRAELMKSRWTPGIRVGVGTHLGHDGWDVNLRYTYLHLKRRGPVINSPLMAVPFVTNFYGEPRRRNWGTSAEARWKFAFNVLDLEMGRGSRLSPCLVVRPYVGVKATWQKENNAFTYRRDLAATESAFRLAYDDDYKDLPGPYFVNSGCKVWGVGLRGGFGFSWLLCNCFNVYGDFSWSMLWADYYDQRRVDTLHDDGPPSVDVVVSDFDNKGYYTVKNLCEFECGLSWETWLCCDSYHLEVRLGWREQVWVNWVRNAHMETGAYSNLSLYGPKLTVQFGF